MNTDFVVAMCIAGLLFALAAGTVWSIVHDSRTKTISLWQTECVEHKACEYDRVSGKLVWLDTRSVTP